MKEEIQKLKENLSVGQTVWVYDGNSRVYGEDKRTIYSGHFKKQMITKLTRVGVHINRSLECDWPPKKVSYKDLINSFTVFFSKEAVENNGLLEKNSYKFMEYIRYSLNFDKYKEILKMFPDFKEEQVDMSVFDE